MDYTAEQKQAIQTLDKSMLVSAAAGSGKTAVLVERIINIILSGAAGVDQMLVVTFTNAAASEMKLKLTKAVRKAIRETGDTERRALLGRQLDMMYRSYISTFHSFALRVIREFFYETDIEPDFAIADEVQSQLMQYEAMEELFDELFENDALIESGSFREFLGKYSGDRSEDAITEAMLGTYSKLRSMPDYFSWAYSRCEDLKTPASGYSDSRIYGLLSERISEEVGRALDSAHDIEETLTDAGCEKLAAKVAEDRRQIEALAGTLNEEGLTDGFFAEAAELNWATLRAAKDEKDSYDTIKERIKKQRDDGYKSIKKLHERYADPDIASRFEEMDGTYRYAVYYLDVLRAFEEKYKAKKAENGVLDFSDIEHITAELLGRPAVAEVLREHFRFIFVDEYQDTNYLQEYLIDKIARPDNVFKVGDIKQSIYGFRQSEPGIFAATAKKYASDDNPDAVTVDLNRNFRSNGRTIKYINDVFLEIMPGYDHKAMLYKGLPGHADYDLVPEVHVLLETSPDGDDDDGPAEGENGAAEEIIDRTRLEAEAHYVAERVSDLIGTRFHDGSTGEVRQATPRDIVILLRNARGRAEVYYRALKEAGIDAHVSDEDGYFDTVEIGVAMSLLSVMDNMKQDVPLIALLHSEIFGFDPSELAEIRAFYIEEGGDGAAHDDYSNALKYYAENGSDPALAGKVRRAFAKLSEWRALSGTMELDEYIWHLIIDSNYYMYAGAMYGGRQRQANLRALADRARTYKESGVASLGDFIRYINVLKKKGVKTGQAMMVSEDDDIVRIMTIHKSKGLEFPFVIVAGLGSKLNFSKQEKGFSFDPDVGAGISFVDKERHYWRMTLIQRLIADDLLEKERQEELRVLYVAMTRAREKLILTGTMRNADKVMAGISGWGTFLDVIAGTFGFDSAELHMSELKYTSRPRRRSTVDDFLSEREGIGSLAGSEIYTEVGRRLGYVYPHADDLSAKSKYSVSELRAMSLQTGDGEGGDGGQIRVQRTRRHEGRTVSAAAVGTAYHRIMEQLDFARLAGDEGSPDRREGLTDGEKDYIREVAEMLAANGAIDEEVYNEVDLGRIETFFLTETGAAACRAAREGTLLREKPFTLRTMHDGRPVLVQGIIDCCYIDRETGGYVLIDYKSGYIRKGVPEDVEEQRIVNEYREQMRIYGEAITAGTGRPVTASYLYLFGLGRAVPAGTDGRL